MSRRATVLPTFPSIFITFRAQVFFANRASLLSSMPGGFGTLESSPKSSRSCKPGASPISADSVGRKFLSGLLQWLQKDIAITNPQNHFGSEGCSLCANHGGAPFYTAVAVAVSDTTKTNTWLMPVVVAILLGTVAYFLSKKQRRRRP